MRVGTTYLLTLAVFVIALTSAEETTYTRQKRFLRFNERIWPLSDSLSQISNYARDLTDTISAQTSKALRHFLPDPSENSYGLFTRPSKRRGEIESEEGDNVPTKKDTEKEVEIFEPEQVETHRIPTRKPDVFNSFIPFSLSFGLFTPWWNGPNICVDRNETEEPQGDSDDLPSLSFNFATTQCMPTESSYVCTQKIRTNGMRKTIIVRRNCCHGYIRRKDGRPGCSALKMENLLQALKTLELDRFVQWIESAELSEKVQQKNFTVFAPSNDAVTDFEDETEDNEISAINPARHLTDPSYVILGHIVEGFVNMDFTEDEQMLRTLNEQSIRINKYTQEVVTANCVPVSGKNNFATNGIIHFVSGVLPQPKESIREILEKDPQFSKFKSLLVENNSLEDLKKPNQSWTIFAPTNSAFDKLSSSLKRQLETGEGCIESIVHQHITKGTICASAITSQLRARNLLDNVVKVTRDEYEKLRIDGVDIEVTDLLGTNGVVHIIDQVLIPLQARNLMTALAKEEREDVIELIEAADLVSTFENVKNVTFFIPSEEAFKNLPNSTYYEMKSNPEFMKKILLHHLAQPYTATVSFRDNKVLTTMDSHDIHLKLHEIFPGVVSGAMVQCAFIVNHDKRACNAVMHKINKVLLPPNGNIPEVLNDMEDHKIVAKLLKNTNLESRLLKDGLYTFLAPTDEAFEKLGDEELQTLYENATKVEKLLNLHVIQDMLCCNSVSYATPFDRQFARTYDGSLLPLYRGLHDRVRFGRARAIRCDISTSNGLIHSISRVILPQRPMVATDLFGLGFFPFT